MNFEPIFYKTIIASDEDVFRPMFRDDLCDIIVYIKQMTKSEEAEYVCVRDPITLAKCEIIEDTTYDEERHWRIQLDDNFSLRIEVGEDATVLFDKTNNWRRARRVEVLFTMETKTTRDYSCEECEEYSKLFNKINKHIRFLCEKLVEKIDEYNISQNA